MLILIKVMSNAHTCTFPGNHKLADRVWTACKRHFNPKWPTWCRYVSSGRWWVPELLDGRQIATHEYNLCLFCLSGGTDEVDEEEAFVDGGGQGGGVSSSSNQPGKPGRKPVRLSRKRHRALANKPQDFQVLPSSPFVLSRTIKTLFDDFTSFTSRQL